MAAARSVRTAIYLGDGRMNEPKRNRLAYHEAGHVLACYLAFGPDEEPLDIVSICARGGLLASISWAKEFDRGDGQEAVENEIVTLLGGAAAEELMFGNSEGDQADMGNAYGLLEGVTRLEDKGSDGEEAKAYLGWLRIRIKNKFRKPAERKALNAVAQELLKSETIQYSAAKNIIEGIISAQNSALQKVKNHREQ
jgi:ATP-dependent Zn protease